jgi:OOP family OmpA-OmpF porin
MMKRHAVTFALLALASSAQALELTTDTYFVASIGQSNIIHTPLQSTNNALINNSGLSIKDLHSKQDNVGGAFKLQVGYEFSPHWSVEGGYVDLGKSRYSASYLASGSFAVPVVLPPFVGVVGGQTTYEPFVSTRVSKISGWNVTGVGSHRINERVSLLGKLGLMRAEIRSHDGSAGFSLATNTTAHRWIATYGVGANYKVNDVFGVRAEFEKYARVGDKDTTGVTDINLTSVGVSAKF